MMKKLLIAGLLAAAMAAPASANIVTNGSFETGDFSGWSQFGNVGATGVVGGGTSGSFQGYFGPVGSQGGINQSLTTSSGSTYTLSFSLAADGNTPNSYSVSVDGNILDSVSNTGGFGYSTRTFAFTATSAATLLSFAFQHDPAYYYLDDVIVEADEVPEPAMLGLFGLGAIGLGLARRRKAA